MEGIDGVVKIVDDILIASSDRTLHEQLVSQVLERCQQNKISLNPKKFGYCCESVPFAGYIVSSEGIKADPTKI